MRSVIVLIFALVLSWMWGCCADPDADGGRDWTVSGTILDADTGELITGAQVEVFFLFCGDLDPPGSRPATPVATDNAGRFTARIRFTTPCNPITTLLFPLSLMHYFGTERTATHRPPPAFLVTVHSDGREMTYRQQTGYACLGNDVIGNGDGGVVVVREDVAGFGIVGTIELPPVLLPCQPDSDVRCYVEDE